MPVQDTQALMDLVFVAVVVVPEGFEAALDVVDAAVELEDAVVAAVVVVVAVVVVAAVVLAAVVALTAVVVVAVAVPLVVGVRVMLPLTEPVVAAVVAAVALAAAVVAVVLAAVLPAAGVVSDVVAAVVAAPVVALEEPSLEPPQPAIANDMVNAQGRISRFAARLIEASAYDDSSCTCAACACSVRKLSFDNFAISPISTIPRGRLFSEVQTTEIKLGEHLYVIRDKASNLFIYGVTLCVQVL